MHSFHGSYSNRGSGAKRASSDAAARSFFSQEEKKEWGAQHAGIDLQAAEQQTIQSPVPREHKPLGLSTSLILNG